LKSTSSTTSTTSTTEEEFIFGQIIYGPDRQPRPRAQSNNYVIFSLSRF